MSRSVADGMTARPEAAPAIRLAQFRELEVFIDRAGNRVYLDAETGEVVAVEPPRRQQVIRVLPPGRWPDRGYDLGDPADRARFLRDREVLLGRREPQRGNDDYWLDVPEQEFEPPYEEPDVRVRPERRTKPGSIVRVPLEPHSGQESAAIAPEAIDPSLQDQSEVPPAVLPRSDASEDVARLQVLLDRLGLSPGVIDGRMGDNVNKAIAAYKEKTGEALRTYDKAAIEKMLNETGGPAFTEYTITPADAAGPFVASVPEDYGEKAKLERLGFTSVAEMLAERFHMDEKYLRALNPGADFSRPGTRIKVVDPGRKVEQPVKRIVADKGKKQVRAYDASGRLVAAYPATIGSASTPSPSGSHEIVRIAFNPEYTYNPKINFKQGNNDRVLQIPPGPNGPVGSIWIALSKPTYGIHGTPEPSKIGKTESHGCVRLTNWDAEELARLVEPGVPVEFID
jgi:lipoprotein-anchoring transpeptidase ErfK/SrfK